MSTTGRETIPSVLIIEDDTNLRAVQASVFRYRGHKVWTAKDGAEGLALLASEDPDIVICDIRMPVMDGIEFLRRKRKLRDATPVIVTTAVDEGETIADAIEMGAVDYLIKPVSVQGLLELVERFHKRGGGTGVALY